MLYQLIALCIKRRLAVIALTLLIAVFGVYAYLRTPVEAYPDVTNVQVEVVAQVSGLAPEEMERQVTIPLERALNGNRERLRVDDHLVCIRGRDGQLPGAYADRGAPAHCRGS